MKKIICIGMLLTGLGLFLSPSVMAISIGFEPAEQFVNVGDKTDVDIVVSELGSEIVSAYDLDVLYDPAILDVTGVTFGNGLGGDIPYYPFFASIQSADETTKGLLNILETSLLEDVDLVKKQQDPFTLATVFFDVIAVGTSPLSLSLNGITKNIVGEDAKTFDKESITLGTGKVAPVPEPATILLLGASLAGVAGFRRKKFNPKTH